MAKEASNEGILWGTQSWFPISQAINPSDEGINGNGDEEKAKEAESSLGEVGRIAGGAANNETTSAREIEKDGAVGSEKNTKAKCKKIKVDNETLVPNSNIQLSSETKRLRKISKMYDDLHALIPELEPKADKVTIVDEAIKLIQSLEQAIKDLEEKKLKKLCGVSTNINTSPIVPFDQNLIINKKAANSNPCPAMSNLKTNSTPNPIFFEPWTSSNVTLNVCGFDAQINICTIKKPGILCTVFFILEKKNLEVVSTFVSSDDAKIVIMIHVRGKIRSEFAKGIAYKEIFKQAANEIMLLLN